MVGGSVSTEMELKVPIERVWKAIKDSNNMFPKAMPDAFTSIETVEGDGKVGSVRLVNFGPAVPYKHAKEKLESVDEVNHSVVLSTIKGGPIGTLFSSEKGTISFMSKEECGTIVTWNLEYDTLVENPPLDRIKANAEKVMKGVEAYLLANNNDYA